MYPLVPLGVDELTWVGWLLLVSLPGLGSVGALLRAPSGWGCCFTRVSAKASALALTRARAGASACRP
jgi:hypothetical protein